MASPTIAQLSVAEQEWVNEVLSWCKPNTTLPVMCTAPETMRLADSDDHIFEPVLVSIGPFHRGKFPAMEEHKTRILSSMLDRHGNMDRRKLLMELVHAVRTGEEKARGYYSKSFPEIDFVKMMVFDGCFLLEIFRMVSGLHDMKYVDDPIFMARWMLPPLALDIVKLENQLPYFILHMLYERTKGAQDPTLSHLAGSFLDSMRPGLNKLMIKDDPFQDHLLSLFHSTFVPDKNLYRVPVNDGLQGNRLQGNRFYSFPSVTDLSLTGIKVVKGKERKNLLELVFINGELQIPTLVIDHSTKILMRNLVPYEQCNKTIPDMFASYLTFLDALVNSAEDVEVLRVAGVINHSLSNNEEVSVVLNNLTANINYHMNQGWFAQLNREIYCYYQSALPRPMTRFRRLINSREGVGQLVTVFGAYLSVFQTSFSVLDYVNPKKS